MLYYGQFVGASPEEAMQTGCKSIKELPLRKLIRRAQFGEQDICWMWLDVVTFDLYHAP